ncbi:sialin-like [Galendromus occidentalis]|uniref:Sialin-like n=1 Tax=Galendromus occidentalis TaxID=34638 RepID=A0AAJ7SE80_9ACAR|nr:sialin-like [Galendromus occidentalis]
MWRKPEGDFEVVETPKYERTGTWRFILAGLFAANLFLLHAMRLTLSVSITAMVNSTSSDPESLLNATCRSPHLINTSLANTSTTEPVVERNGEFNWSKEEQSRVTYAFFAGYMISQVPGGYIAQTYSFSWTVGVGVAFTSILTCLTSFAARLSLYALLALRFLEGIGEGVITPCIFVFVTKWVPIEEQGFLLNLVASGSTLAMVSTMPLSAMLCASDLGWPSAFYIFGFGGIVSCILWLINAADGPEHHRWISREERDYIMEYRPPSTKRSPKFVPWRRMLLSPVVILLSIQSLAKCLNFYTILTELPSYLKYMFGIYIVEDGLINGGIHLGTASSLVFCGWAADKIIKERILPKSVVRRTCIAVSGFIPALCLATIPFVGCNYEVILALILLNCICFGFSGGGDSLLALDLAPKFAGTLQGIVGTVSHSSGVIAPMFVGIMTNDQDSLLQWNLIFGSLAVIGAVWTALFLTFGSTEEQEWARDEHEAKDDITTLCDE